MSHIVAAPFYHLKAVRDGRTVAYWSRVFGWVKHHDIMTPVPVSLLDGERQRAEAPKPAGALVVAEPTR